MHIDIDLDLDITYLGATSKLLLCDCLFFKSSSHLLAFLRERASRALALIP